MGRSELVFVMALILLAAFGLGWGAHWLFRRLNRIDTSNVAELDRMAAALHEAEETRDAAILTMQEREAELLAQLGQTQAELQAAMDGLGEARREAAELRAWIEQNS